MAEQNAAYALDKRRLRAQFERASPTYDAAAVLQRQIADQLLERLDVIKRALARRYRRADVTGVDLAASMARAARRQSGWFGPKRFACADAERLPFGAASFDMVLSNLMLQWCAPAAVFDEMARVLAPDGLLMFTTFGPDTLRELKQAWRQ